MGKLHANFIGGLGNNMFQIAAMESLAKDNGLTVNYINPKSFYQYMREYKRTSTYEPMDYLKIFKNFHFPSEFYVNDKIIEIPYGYFEIHPKDNDSYWGYFQSEKYFKHNRDFILHLFEPATHVQKQVDKYKDIFKGTTCSIHVRRGDYLKYPETHYVQNMEYYLKSAVYIDMLLENKMQKVDRYIIFSDDFTWCKKMFLNDSYFYNKEIIFIDNEKDYVELFMMSQCTHHIIANSSFSWWGAWLNQNRDKIVIAPKKWWSGNCEDIIPETWIKI